MNLKLNSYNSYTNEEKNNKSILVLQPQGESFNQKDLNAWEEKLKNKVKDEFKNESEDEFEKPDFIIVTSGSYSEAIAGLNLEHQDEIT